MLSERELEPYFLYERAEREFDIWHSASSFEDIAQATHNIVRPARDVRERGFEDTTTAAICRLAGTSQSQLIKHFTDKQGVLEAIFEHAWEQINPAVRLATENIASPREKLRVLIDMVLGFLEKDRAIRNLFLLEGRRIRSDGHMIVLVPGFTEFIKMLDGILKELAAQGELIPNIHPQTLRSARMGAIEGMLRDPHAGP